MARDEPKKLDAEREIRHYIYQWPYDFTEPDNVQSTLESAALESAAAFSNTLRKQLIGLRNS